MCEQIQSENTNVKDGEILTDYRDALYFEQRVFLTYGCFKASLYEDEFEIVNSLSSKKMKCKLCAFYYTIGTLGGKYKSQFKNLHLAFRFFIHMWNNLEWTSY